MPLSLAEIKLRAINFSKDWHDASRERAEAQTFWNEFFHVFGIQRRTVATFEEPVKNLKGDTEFIDLFWPGKLIAEHKTRGRDLAKAHTQAIGYVHSLASLNRADQSPRYIIVSDFARIALHDLEDESNSLEFPLADLHKHIRRFAFIAGYESRRLDPEDPANERAVEKLANLHDQLEQANFTGHALERFLVRILFCLFAEDTDLFEPESFTHFLTNHTTPDGSDLGPQLSRLFQILDTPTDRRPTNLPEDLAAFPYVNGQLFSERLDIPECTSRQRVALMDCAHFQWSKISPAIFGSLFQDVMASDKANKNKRRQIGAHYTSERDIMKVIRSLFLDDLRSEFETLRGDKKRLAEFHRKLSRLKFLDPACGCGNFLVITYRELRLLELDTLKATHGTDQAAFDIGSFVRVDVDQLYGIEIEEWPARIAEVALWLLDHQMNQLASETFGRHYNRLPLKAAPHILVANALRTDWNDLLAAADCSYVLGNPPFVGKHLMTGEQYGDMQLVWGDSDRAGTLDYVTAWYKKASEYIRGTAIEIAFVSTNSVTQGEQVAPLWEPLFKKGIRINFGHRTFPWMSESRGKAHVHVVIVGFAFHNSPRKRMYDYDSDPANPSVAVASNITPYLTEGASLAISPRRTPIASVPPCIYGNKPTDGGNLIIEDEERDSFLAANPCATDYIRELICAEEYLDGRKRWCLWLVDAPPSVLRSCRGIHGRIEAVCDFRLKSKKSPTREKATTPSLFAEIRQPKGEYVVIPRHSSERRNYIPFGFFGPEVIVHDSCTALPNASPYHFGVMSSVMHMAWVRAICGRIKSDYRYSSTLVYNTFPWPNPILAQRRRVADAAQIVLGTRAEFLSGGSTLSDLYDPLTMPKPLADAHHALDMAVDRAYRPQPFPSDRHRFEFLFTAYEQLIAPLAATTPKARVGKGLGREHRH